ncbi:MULTISPECIES: calcium-binding protein [unclassified Microcoleus]|uniref:calcium-binding protein n=1 Tax=unclassified Microcoleus TaxID=2642155 RepID=UPI002FD748C5
MAAGTNGNDALYSDRPSTIPGWRFVGLQYDPYLSGLGGNDSLYGGARNDFLSGGDGDDFLFAADGSDFLNGDAGNDFLDGGNGNDSLNGGTGNDTMVGGAGDDFYSVDRPEDRVIEALNGGIDTVESSIEYYQLGDNVENLILTGNTANSGIGNSLKNLMVGNGENNALLGLAGNDTLLGNAGDDQLSGSDGNDSMVGGIGNDTYGVDDIGDLVVEDAESGTDSIIATINYTLRANVENLYLDGNATSGVGNNLNNFIGLANTGSDRLGASERNLALLGKDGDDTLEGSSGNDLLHGGTGNDLMRGNSGDDIYGVESAGDIVIEQADNGIDKVVAAISYTLPDNVENLTLFDKEAIAGSGNSLNNVIIGNDGDNKLDGGDGDDTIYGQDGNDNISGGNGNDVLLDILDPTVTATSAASKTDADILTGGAGDDRFVYTRFNDAGDILTDFGNGNDVLDLRRDLFANTGNLIGDPIAEGYLRLVNVDGSTQVQIDLDGTEKTREFATLVTIKGMTPDGLKIGQNFLVPTRIGFIAPAPQPAPQSAMGIENIANLLG